MSSAKLLDVIIRIEFDTGVVGPPVPLAGWRPWEELSIPAKAALPGTKPMRPAHVHVEIGPVHWSAPFNCVAPVGMDDTLHIQWPAR